MRVCGRGVSPEEPREGESKLRQIVKVTGGRGHIFDLGIS